MKLVCMPNGIVGRERPGQGIMDIRRAGFQELVCDLSMFCNSYELENYGKEKDKDIRKTPVSQEPEMLYEYLKQMIAKGKEAGLAFSIAAAPGLSSNTKRDDIQRLLLALAEESIKICGKLGIGYLVVQPLFAGVAKAKIWDTNRSYYLGLAELAKENRVMLLLENQCRNINGHLVRGICADGMEAAEWVDRLNSEAGEERFGFCMDVGVCNLCGQNLYDFIHTLGDRIKAVVVRDNNGSQENSLLPFTAVYKGRPQTNWLNLIRGLRDICYDGLLILNMADTATAVSPILRPDLLRYAKSVMDYLKWQIEIESLLKKYSSRVLFGAGNMCRNYMKCYGEQYPPLYTCDNNRSLWNAEFCGLSVKPPEVLKELPSETAVFICNIYYREIEKQLRDMGLQNPIEFFNDEYMPSFYFDRLDSEGRK